MRDSKQQIKVHIHPGKQQREQHAFLPSVIFLDQTTKIFSESPSITMVLWFKLCGFFRTNCVFLIGWQWYYDWMDPCRQKIPGAKGQWGNLSTRMNAEHFQGHDQTQEHCEYSTTSNTVLKWAVPLSVGVLKDPNQPDISATQHAWMKFNYTHIFGLIVLHLL